MYTLIACFYIEHLLETRIFTHNLHNNPVTLVLLVFYLPIILGHRGLVLPQDHKIARN